jgi:peptidoglycan/xylan/chitin deacetylase (PgdA/CDA1 family)
MNLDRLRILLYHRIIDLDKLAGDDPSLVSAPPTVFGRQMRHLAQRYRVVTMEQVLEALRGSHRLPDRAVLITFDDAYRDFGEIAWPILRRYGLAATLFVPTAFPGRPQLEFWWDRLHRAFLTSSRTKVECEPIGSLPLDTPEGRRTSLRLVQLYLKSAPHSKAKELASQLFREMGVEAPGTAKVLSWPELKELASDGVTLGAHTLTHPTLSRLPIEQARTEIVESREELRRELGSVLPIFAYPYGAYNEQVVDVMREEGFQAAFTCREGHNRIPGTDPLQLQRTNIMRKTSPLIFRFRLRSMVAYADVLRQRAKHATT